MRTSLAACALGLAGLSVAGAQSGRWRLQYFYDESKTELQVRDLASPSAKHVIAIGSIIEEKRGSRKPVAVATVDGGEHWDIQELDEHPVSIFFLNDSLGWMVTEKGIWQTEEGGKDWKKLPKPPVAALRVFFVDENNGWAACTKKTLLVTHDGGRKWESIKAAQDMPGAPERSVFTWFGFANKDYGLVLGFNQPLPRWGEAFPAWMDPEDAVTRREGPHLSYTLMTHDGGKTWSGRSTSLLGHVTKARFTEKGPGLGLVELGQSSAISSEVYDLDWRTGKNQACFRDKRYMISDVWLTPSGVSYLAGVEVVGRMHGIIPGAVKVFRSTDRKSWTEMPVDYRATAQRVTFSGYGEDQLWLATDSGMILKLQ